MSRGPHKIYLGSALLEKKKLNLKIKCIWNLGGFGLPNRSEEK